MPHSRIHAMKCDYCGDTKWVGGDECPQCSDRAIKPARRSEECCAPLAGSAATWHERFAELHKRIAKRPSYYSVQTVDFSELLTLLDELATKPPNGGSEGQQEA